MLLAEINGKPCPEVEGVEDLITSAVFGHLRLVAPPVFWKNLLQRARTVESESRSLSHVLRARDLAIDQYSSLKIHFWPWFPGFGEPDLLLHFESLSSPPLLVMIEVKLNSGKSSTGESDQLAKYLRLLRHEPSLEVFGVSTDLRFLIYLTRNFAVRDMKESLLAAGSPPEWLFGLRWNDILEVAVDERSNDPLLAEVADFLLRRGLQAFSGVEADLAEVTAPGHFYFCKYFGNAVVLTVSELEGSFYGH